MKLALRMAFSILFGLILLSTALTTTQRMDELAEGECLRDQMFTLTSTVNNFLSEHPTVTNGFIIYSSMLMDFIIVSYCFVFLLYWKTYRLLITYILFFGIRTIV